MCREEYRSSIIEIDQRYLNPSLKSEGFFLLLKLLLGERIILNIKFYLSYDDIDQLMISLSSFDDSFSSPPEVDSLHSLTGVREFVRHFRAELIFISALIILVRESWSRVLFPGLQAGVTKMTPLAR